MSAEKIIRGFGYLKIHNPEHLKSIASMGGIAAHEKGTAHEWTSEEASVAGKKGGIISAQRAAARRLKQIRTTPKNKKN